MKCLVCGGKTRVGETRVCGNDIIRIRWCTKCYKHFPTKELIISKEEAKQKMAIYRKDKNRGKKNGIET